VHTTTKVALIRRGEAGRAPSWTLRWHDSNGKRQHESIGRCDGITKKLAQDKRRAKELALNGGEEPIDKPAYMTLATFLKQDRDSRAGDVRESTLLEHDFAGAHATAVLGADMELARITVADVGKIKAELVGKGRAAATVHKTLRTLRGAFNRAAKLKLIHRNPFMDVKLPRVEETAKRVFAPVEVSALLKAVADDLWWEAFITLAVTSGLRRDELLNLKWSDVDFKDGTVKVQPKKPDQITVAVQVRKSDGTTVTETLTLKTWEWFAKAKASYRTVPLPQATVDVLQRQRVKQGGSPFVFITVARLRQLQRHIADGALPAKFEIVLNLLRRFGEIQDSILAAMKKDAADPSKVEWPRGCLHDMRRSYCTRMAETVPMHVLKKWAGHSDIATTASFYLGESEGMADKARQAFTAIA